MNKKIISIFILLTFVFPLVRADGGMWYPHNWEPIPENSQTAAISYKNGIETMLLSISPNNPDAEEAVWIFPIASPPKDVAIDILTQFPSFYGENVEYSAKRYIDDAAKAIRLTQLYTIPFYAFLRKGVLHFEGSSRLAAGAAHASDINEGVVIHEHIEKQGVTSEIVTAKQGEALYEYLRRKGLNINPDSIEMFDSYVDKDYSFVVSWISNYVIYNPNTKEYVKPFRAYQISLQTTFPTKQIYFPLIPTSVYGSETIPIVVYVTAHVTPKLYDKIEPYTKINYYYLNNQVMYFPRDLQPDSMNEYQRLGMEFSNAKKYTRVDINAPSKYFVDDLWFSNSAPAKINYATFISQHKVIFGLLFLLLVSMIASFLAGIIMFRNLNREWIIKYVLLSLAGCLTLIGTIVAAIFTKTRELSPKLKKAMKDEKIFAIAFDSRKIAYVILFTLFFVIASFILQWIFKAPF